MSRLVVEHVPDALKAKFKLLCASEGKTMRDKVLELLEQEAARWEVTVKPAR